MVTKSGDLAQHLLQLSHVEGEIERNLDRLGGVALVVVDVNVGLELHAVIDDLMASLRERFLKVGMGRVGIVHIGPQGDRLGAALFQRRVFGAIASAVTIHAVFFAERLRNVAGDRVDDRGQVGLVQAVAVRPLGDGVRIEQPVGADLRLVALDVLFDCIRNNPTSRCAPVMPCEPRPSRP